MEGLVVRPRRRTCALCGRAEQVSLLHLTDVYVNGVLRRACENCRRDACFYCQAPHCRRQEGGRAYRRPNGLVYCCRCMGYAE